MLKLPALIWKQLQNEEHGWLSTATSLIKFWYLQEKPGRIPEAQTGFRFRSGYCTSSTREQGGMASQTAHQRLYWLVCTVTCV